MRLLAILACLLIASMAVAGCSSKKKDDGGSSSSSTSSHATSSSSSSSSSRSSSSTSSSSSSSTASANHPPTGSISASVSSGGLPLNVNFTLAGSDEDHDTLVWDLAFGDGAKTNGTALPKTVSHDYTAAGNFTAVYSVTDGKDPVSYNVTIKVIAGGGNQVVITMDVMMNCINCEPPQLGAFPGLCISWEIGMSGIDCGFAPLDPSTIGKPFTLTATNNGDADLTFFPDCSAPLDPTATGIEDHLNTGDESGTIPVGAGCVVAWTFFGNDPPNDTAGGTMTLTIG